MASFLTNSRATRLTATLAVTAAAAGFGITAGGSSRAQTPSGQSLYNASSDSVYGKLDANAVSFGFLPDPDFGPGYTTDGSYPQVASGTANFASVNVALKQAFVADETQTRQSFAGLSTYSADFGSPGSYATYPDEGVLYADHSIVSILVPADADPPNGVNEAKWISLTLLIPSARTVTISDLFARPESAFQVLRNLVGNSVAVSAPCPASDLAGIDTTISNAVDNLQPNAATFARFALTPYGLTIGFEQGTVTDESCGATIITASWPSLQTMLSPLGVTVERDVTS